MFKAADDPAALCPLPSAVAAEPGPCAETCPAWRGGAGQDDKAAGHGRTGRHFVMALGQAAPCHPHVPPARPLQGFGSGSGPGRDALADSAVHWSLSGFATNSETGRNFLLRNGSVLQWDQKAPLSRCL